MVQKSTIIRLAAPPDDLQECKLDIGEFVEQLPKEEVMVLCAKLICADERPFQVMLENSRAIERMNGIGYLWVVACRIFWKDMAVHGWVVDSRILFLEEWQDQFEEELERNGTLSKFPKAYEEGLKNVGTTGIFKAT